MEPLPSRLAELSPERRLLLERLLAGAAPSPAQVTAEVSPIQAPQILNPQKQACRGFYDQISRRLDNSAVGQFSLFLNLGYSSAGTPSASIITLPDHYLNKNSVQLVLEVIGDCELAGRRVLDVGCGRGGSISVIRQFFNPDTICGIDLAPAAIQFCRTNQRDARVRFEVGDAEHLPFPDSSMDVVTNIESSSTYPDIFAFYQQVFRVLKPGGHFLYTDALPTVRFAEGAAYMRRQGFNLELDRDITANVLASCDELASQRLDAFAAQVDSNMRDFLGAPGSEFYDEMKRGAWAYRIQRWQKPVASRIKNHAQGAENA
jgi:ubiquinone/menaquinone biosynthesis C-methylase UbiE